MDVAISPRPRFDLRRVMFEEAGDSSEIIRSDVEADLTEVEQVEFLVYNCPTPVLKGSYSEWVDTGSPVTPRTVVPRPPSAPNIGHHLRPNEFIQWAQDSVGASVQGGTSEVCLRVRGSGRDFLSRAEGLATEGPARLKR
jgi:hypothetical protein